MTKAANKEYKICAYIGTVVSEKDSDRAICSVLAIPDSPACTVEEAEKLIKSEAGFNEDSDAEVMVNKTEIPIPQTLIERILAENTKKLTTYVGVLDDEKYGQSTATVEVDQDDPDFNEEEVIKQLKEILNFCEFDDPKECHEDTAGGIKGYFDQNKKHIVWFSWHIA